MTERELVILSLFPEASNIHGDAENAAVLAARAQWAGHTARVIELPLGRSLSDALDGATPNVVVIGSGFDDDALRLRDGLLEIRPALVDWHEGAVPILAIGNGWELLAAQVELRAGEPIAGVGIFPGRVIVSANHAPGHLIIQTRFGQMIGYEYPSRDYLPSEGELTLGSVVSGHGNGYRGANSAANADSTTTASDSRAEGSEAGSAFGTHLRGPVLARNPAFADAILTLALGDNLRDRVRTESMHSVARNHRDAADTFAATVNQRLLSQR